MMFINIVIKTLYIELGYLPNYPYHMITDEEMIDAFIREDGYFNDFYPCPGASVQEAYDALREQITTILEEYLDANQDRVTIPNWVYSYMLGNVITFQSDPDEISYLYDLTGIEPHESFDVFDIYLAEECLAVSTEWLKKQSSQEYRRVPTMFGEPHVIKSLRLATSDILTNG